MDPLQSNMKTYLTSLEKINLNELIHLTPCVLIHLTPNVFDCVADPCVLFYLALFTCLAYISIVHNLICFDLTKGLFCPVPFVFFLKKKKKISSHTFENSTFPKNI